MRLARFKEEKETQLKNHVSLENLKLNFLQL